MSGFQPGEDGREKIEVPEHYFQTLGYIVQSRAIRIVSWLGGILDLVCFFVFWGVVDF